MNKTNLLETLKIQTKSYGQGMMIAYIKKRVKNIKGAKLRSDKHGNIYVTKGVEENYPCVVSHMDTVHDIYKDFAIFEHDDKWFAFDGELNRQVGIGGDDKVGVFITLEALEHFDNIKVAFFVDEEVGTVGSKKADMSFFNNVGFVLQCDRKGYGDFVNDCWKTELYAQDFSGAVAGILEQYGYKESDGGLTDVVALKENGLAVACANMSCGYYKPHTDEEYIVLEDVKDCHNMVLDIIESLQGQRFEHEHTKTVDDDWFSRGYDWRYSTKCATNGKLTGTKNWTIKTKTIGETPYEIVGICKEPQCYGNILLVAQGCYYCEDCWVDVSVENVEFYDEHEPEENYIDYNEDDLNDDIAMAV